MNATRCPSQLEPLESRIAPASILVGTPGEPGNVNYDTASTDPKIPVFYNTLSAGGSVNTSLVGGTADTYYIKLTAGDQIQQFAGGLSTLLKVTKGTVVAFFVDANGDKVVDPGELSAISVGAGASFDLRSGLPGSVVSNYDAAANQIVMNGLLGPKQSISGISTGGGIGGGIYAGGSISKVKINGTVTEILNGSAADGVSYDLLVGAAGGEGTLSVTPASKEAGTSIKDIEVNGVTRIVAGSGGEGAKGGDVTQVKVLADIDGLQILAGNGGASPVTGSGGAGGNIGNIYIAGASDSTAETIVIAAGNGGSNAAGTAAAVLGAGGKGGAGGKLQNIYIGFDYSNGKPIASFGLLQDAIDISSGNGGSGKTGGVGGTMTNVQILSGTKDTVVADDIFVHAGVGGAANDSATGTNGAGGSIANLSITNVNPDTSSRATVTVTAGDGGSTVAPNVAAKGAAGGGVNGLTILSYITNITAGEGSSGKTGGAGGSISKVNFLQNDAILANAVQLTAGAGGQGFSGNGGKGGSINTLILPNSELASFALTSGDGGKSINGKGGDGGVLTVMDVTDQGDVSGLGYSGVIKLRSGVGGDGDKGGGRGGEISKGTFFAEDLVVDVVAGNGGSATVSGAGGAGGNLIQLNITADGLVGGVSVDGLAQAGTGGNALGKGKGGNGGSVSFANLNVDGSVTILAGDGGVGTASTAGGAGGNIAQSGAFGRDGSGILTAGDAGVGGAAAKGGSIAGKSTQVVGLRALTALTVTAGVGSGGGDGGSISYFAFGSTSDSLAPTPVGDILIQAGDGSIGTKSAGKGGSISNISGNPSSGTTTTTQILAGKGADSATTKKGGDGGQISEVVLSGVGDDTLVGNTVNIVVAAGDGGAAPTAKTGAKGGGVKNVSVAGLDPDATLRSVAAGNGGAASLAGGKGGLGGTIDGVRVSGAIDQFTGAKLNGDIGYRSGQSYGYATMGGLFAGAGGAGTVVGLAGSVKNIAADSIAAIVAGRDSVPQAVEKVEKVYLNALNRLYVNAVGSFNTVDFVNANIVGAIVNPSAVDAPIFKYVDVNGNSTFDAGDLPTDGLIVARAIDAKTINFNPEAYVLDGTFFDNTNH